MRGNRPLVMLVAVLVAVVACGLWFIHPMLSQYRWAVLIFAILAFTWPMVGFLNGPRAGFWGINTALEIGKRWRGRVGMVWFGLWSVACVLAWTPRVVWLLAAVLSVSVMVGLVMPSATGRARRSLGRRVRLPGFLARINLSKMTEGLAERIEVRRGWEADCCEIITGRPIRDVPEEKRPPFPRLLRRGVRVDEHMRVVTIEPPSSWQRKDVAKFASQLTAHWSGHAPTVRVFHRKRGKKRCYTIAVHMHALPKSVPWPKSVPAGRGAPFATGLSGRIERIEFTPGGNPAHILIAGTTGMGKTSLVRAAMQWWVDQGYDVWVLDPKNEGNLDGISPRPTVSSYKEIADALVAVERLREERSEGAKRGETFRTVVVVVDELIDVIVPPDKASKQVRDNVARGRDAYSELIRKARSVDIHIVSCTQEPSADLMGGSGFLRRNHHGRILIGQADRVLVEMMFSGKSLTPDDLDALSEADPGRALICDVTPSGGKDVRPCQVWWRPRVDPSKIPMQLELLDLTFESSPRLAELPEDDGPDDEPAVGLPSASPSPLDDEWCARSYEHLREHGDTSRADLARALGMKPDDRRVRVAVERLEDAGLVSTSKRGARQAVWVELVPVTVE